MQDVITIGKKLVPVEQIAFVEPFDPSSNPEFKSDRPFKSRVVLVNRDMMLSEMTPHDFAGGQGFRMLADDTMAVNHAVGFRVETFSPTESFQPNKPYLTRIKWRDGEGNEHSKLLLSKPETVIAIVLRGAIEGSPTRKTPQRPRATRGPRRSTRKLEAVRA